MNYTDPFVLRDDVLLIPCADLSDDVRARITFDDGDFTLSRRHGRALAQVIDRDTAALLELFRKPRTLVDAIVENSRALGKDAEARFDELLPHLGTFVNNRVLVPLGSEEEKEIRPQFESGTEIGEWKIVRCASLIEDSEIYQLRGAKDVAALKIARNDTEQLRRLFDNEAAILRHLEGSDIAPRLLEAGVHEERPYLIVEWLAGVDAGVAASLRRHDRPALIELCASIAAAYAELHARGVLHADVHPRNILVDGRVKLLDFGYSCLIGEESRIGRGGVTHFFEPEYLAAEREGRAQLATEKGEQYSVAALIYLLIVAHPYLNFRYDRAEMTKQAETEPPLPFAQRSVPPWPEVERVLFRALEKDPERRFASMAEIAALLADVREVAVRESLARPVSAEAHALLDDTLRSMSRGGETYTARYPIPPTATINYGAAGAAMGLLRIAEVRGDPALLALAAVWQSRAAALIGTEGAYHNEEMRLTPEILGEISPYHSDTGIHAVAAMIAAARGDTYSQHSAIGAFLRAAKKPCAEVDITLGRLAAVHGATLLLGSTDELPDSAAALRAFGSETVRDVWEELDRRPAIAGAPEETLGMAHGWAGYLYATMRWCEASGDPLPARFVERLRQFAEVKTMKGRGAFWRIKAGDDASSIMPGWCNGTAGQVFTFTLAHRLLGDDEWLQHAELAAWNNWDEPRIVASLCCGTAGRAYALLNLYKHTGETAWLSRARQLANHAASAAAKTSQQKNALWKGELGVAVLIADLSAPEHAKMPFFE